MSYFTLNNKPTDSTSAPRKSKASFADFLSNSGPEESNNSIQNSPEKNDDLLISDKSLETSPIKPETSFDSQNKVLEAQPHVPKEDTTMDKRESIKAEKRESVIKNDKRESIITTDKRESIKTDSINESIKRESIKTDKRESIKISEKRESIKTTFKRESIKQDSKRESIKQDSKRESFYQDSKKETLKKSNLPEIITENPKEENPEKKYSMAPNSLNPNPNNDFDSIAHPPMPKSPMHRQGIPLLKHAYTIVEHKVEFPMKNEFDTPFIPKYYDDKFFILNKYSYSNLTFFQKKSRSFELSDEEKKPKLKAKNQSKFKDLTLHNIEDRGLKDGEIKSHPVTLAHTEESPVKVNHEEVSFAENKEKNKSDEKVNDSQFNSADYPQIEQKNEVDQYAEKEEIEEEEPEKIVENDVVNKKKKSINEVKQEANKEDDEDVDVDDDDDDPFFVKKKLKKSIFAPKEKKNSIKNSKNLEEESHEEKEKDDEEKNDDDDDDDYDEDDDEEDDEEEIQRKEREEIINKLKHENYQNNKENKEKKVKENDNNEDDDQNEEENENNEENDHNEEENEDDEDENGNEEDPNNHKLENRKIPIMKLKEEQEENEENDQEDEENYEEPEEDYYEKQEEEEEKGDENKEESDEEIDEENQEDQNELNKKKLKKKNVYNELDMDSYILDEGAKERKKKYVENLTQNYLDKLNRSDIELNKNNISYKIINEMLNGENNGSPEKNGYDEVALKKQLENLQQLIESKLENYNIINSDYQNYTNSLNLNMFF